MHEMNKIIFKILAFFNIFDKALSKREIKRFLSDNINLNTDELKKHFLYKNRLFTIKNIC